jgi:hypothetical protein
MQCYRLEDLSATDGDLVFPPYKIERSGLWDKVDSRVVIYIARKSG